MALFRKIRRRPVRSITTPLAAAGFAGAYSPVNTAAAVLPKKPGEVKIVAFMGGDYGHNAIPLEMHIRGIFSKKRDWRILFVQASDFFSPELISDTDLLIISRHSRHDDIGWRTEGIVEKMEKGALLWTERNVDAIINNVRNRGMGFLALHNTIACRNEKMVNFLGIIRSWR